METSTAHQKAHHRTTWCCSFKTPPQSPDSKNHHPGPGPKPVNPYPSPQTSKSGLSLVGRIDRRRILSPGRVSPIDSDPIDPNVTQDEMGPGQNRNLCVDEQRVGVNYDKGLFFDVRLSLKAKNGGGFLVLEVNSLVLVENSPVFAGLVAGFRPGSRPGDGVCGIEMCEIENLSVFRQTIELMFEKDVVKKLLKIGPFRVIDILEVSTSIKFNRGVISCLKYLEAVPWTEEEEEKLRRLFTKLKLDNAISNEILSRFNLPDSCGAQQKLACKLVHSITSCGNVKARNELKSMVKGLLSKSSVYEKDHLDITKEDLYSVSQSCLSSLVTLFQEASSPISPEQVGKSNPDKPLIQSVSWQVENIKWLLELLLDSHMAEEFVDIWTNQKELLEIHDRASPLVRYELSRVSAALFVAIGTSVLQCRSEIRCKLLQSWFAPMLRDFGWLQRCRKGLDTRELEEAMGQTLLTLPLKHQYSLFMEWFRYFSKHGTECPNLSKAFQIWWRRSFLRGSETQVIESQ